MSVKPVAAMFEPILQDNNIADALRALLGHIPIPMIWLATLDPHFWPPGITDSASPLQRLADCGPCGSAVISSVEQASSAKLHRSGRLNITQQFFPADMFLMWREQVAARGAGGHELCVVSVVGLGA